MNTEHIKMILVLSVYTIFVGSVFIATAVGRWLVFKKMGLPGWKGIIPFYSEAVLFKTVWTIKMFWAYFSMFFCYLMICAAVFALGISGWLYNRGGTVTVLLFLLILIVAWGILAAIYVILFKMNNRLARAFGRIPGFAVGLTFIPPVFFIILGAGKSKFLLNRGSV